MELVLHAIVVRGLIFGKRMGRPCGLVSLGFLVDEIEILPKTWLILGI